MFELDEEKTKLFLSPSGVISVKLVTAMTIEALEHATLIAESNEFAIYDVGNDTYALVHRHAAVEWQAITISGDGIFRVLEILASATRTLYRDVASDLSRQRHLEPR